MSLIVEDGTGVEGADSYVSLEEANEYHTNLANMDWVNSTNDTLKEAYLRKAALFLDGVYGIRASGVPKTTDQGLLFPEVGAYYINGEPVDPDSIPRAYKAAQCEAALLCLNGVDLTINVEGGAQLKRRKIDVLEKEWFEGSASAKPVFGWIDTLLANLFGTPNENSLAIGTVERA